jgi:hypothetical protein
VGGAGARGAGSEDVRVGRSAAWGINTCPTRSHPWPYPTRTPAPSIPPPPGPGPTAHNPHRTQLPTPQPPIPQRDGDAIVVDYFDDPNIKRNGRLDMLQLKEYSAIKRLVKLGASYGARLEDMGVFSRFDTAPYHAAATRAPTA